MEEGQHEVATGVLRHQHLEVSLGQASTSPEHDVQQLVLLVQEAVLQDELPLAVEGQLKDVLHELGHELLPELHAGVVEEVQHEALAAWYPFKLGARVS